MIFLCRPWPLDFPGLPGLSRYPPIVCSLPWPTSRPILDADILASLIFACVACSCYKCCRVLSSLVFACRVLSPLVLNGLSLFVIVFAGIVIANHCHCKPSPLSPANVATLYRASPIAIRTESTLHLDYYAMISGLDPHEDSQVPLEEKW